MAKRKTNLEKMTAHVNAAIDAANKGKENPSSRGRALGYAAYASLDAPECVEAAIEMLEQWNGHLSVAAIGAIEKGRTDPRYGKVLERKGNILTIQLPDHWSKL